MDSLLAIGFEPVGHWLLRDGRLAFELTRHATARNILYAFVVDGAVRYVGKTIQPLRTRMAGYRTPGSSQTTNIRNNERLFAEVNAGAAVDIFALPDNGLMHYGAFHINLAAALEDDIIRQLNPEWNGGATEHEELAAAKPVADEPSTAPGADAISTRSDVIVGGFELTLQRTYWLRGFFNVGVREATEFGADGETIEIFCGASTTPLLGVINRRANANGTPRILGGTALRDWFQRNSRESATIEVAVLSPNAIRLVPALDTHRGAAV